MVKTPHSLNCANPDHYKIKHVHLLQDGDSEVGKIIPLQYLIQMVDEVDWCGKFCRMMKLTFASMNKLIPIVQLEKGEKFSHYSGTTLASGKIYSSM